MGSPRYSEHHILVTAASGGRSDAVAGDFRALLLNSLLAPARSVPGLRHSLRGLDLLCGPQCPGPARLSGTAGGRRETGDGALFLPGLLTTGAPRGPGGDRAGGAVSHCLFSPFGVMFHKSFGRTTYMLIALNK